MRIEGRDAQGLAARFGTPLYVYSSRSILKRFQSLRRAFRRLRPLICYAMKANSNRSIGRLLAEQGAGADIVSGGELRRALAAGFAARRIVFSGIGKSREELELALRKGILSINVESREELEALAAAARRLKTRAPVSIRLNPDVDAGTHPHITTGLAENKFGLEEKEALALCRKAAADPRLRLMGVQCHIGSQITRVGPYRLAARRLARLAGRLDHEGVKLSLINIGGGLGVGSGAGEGIDPEALAAAVERELRRLPGVRLILEPGRFLVADAGVLLTRVLYRKETSRRRFVVVDAAMNDLARPALYGALHPVVPIWSRPGRRRRVDVVGPICETGDFLARRRLLAPVKAGDLLAVLQCGAYGFSMSSQYNSRPRAAEVLVTGTKARLIRRRETWKDLVRGET